MAVAVRKPMSQDAPLRPVLLADDRRPYRCGGKRANLHDCNRRIADVEGAETLLVTCERCGQEHAFALQTARERALEAQVTALLALLAYVSYDGGASAT